MIEKIEPSWCYEEDTYEQAFEEEYELDYADEYHELMMLGEI